MNELQRAMRHLLSQLRPYAAVGHEKIRLGPAHDCGYVMLDDFAPIKAAIGCGVGWNVDFEWQLAERGIEVDLFDHTVEDVPRKHPRFWFHRRKLAVAPQDGQASIDLDGIARRLAVPQGAALLKIDIEGDEWALFKHASRQAFLPYRQIVCEIHWLEKASDPQWYATALAAVQNLTRDFAVVHVHANNFGAMLSFGDGLLVPSVLELTLANRRYYRLRRSAEEFPTPLDAPNNSNKPDTWLGRFDFSEKPGQPLWQRIWRQQRSEV